MNAVTPITAAEDAAAPDLAIERAEARLRDLEELRGMCMSIARVVQKQALAQGDLQDIGDTAGAKEVLGSNVVTLAVRGDFGLVIDRVARSVRLTVMLEEKLEKIIRDLKAGVATALREDLVRRRRGEVERVMMTAIRARHRAHSDRIERDREHLEDYLGREDLAERPVSQTVRRLCDMIGVEPNWSRWADEPWAEEEARAGVAGTPFRVKAAARPPVPEAGPPPDSS